MKQVYFDNAATTKPDERVAGAMLPWMREKFGNPSSVHRWGREAKVLVEDTRDLISDFIGAKPSEIYFTSGGTEANNFAIKGIAFSLRSLAPRSPFGKTPFRITFSQRNHIISTRIEHSSVVDTLGYLEERFGFKVSYVQTDQYGRVNPEDIENEINENTFLICMMHSNNELGVINDIHRLGIIAQEKGVLLHSDSVQSIGKTSFNVNKLGCSSATISAHKIYGPKGIGAIYVCSGMPIDKFLHGGKQERDRRGGTENVAAIAGFKKAVEILKERMDDDVEHYKKLKKRLIAKLQENFGEKIKFNSLVETGLSEGLLAERPVSTGMVEQTSLPNIVNFSFDTGKVKSDPETILIKLDMKGIAVSSGSACTSGTVKPSHVLKAIGYDDETAKSSIRVSFGRYNAVEEVDYLVDVLREIIS
jgi:cysteine desulfurase